MLSRGRPLFVLSLLLGLLLLGCQRPLADTTISTGDTGAAADAYPADEVAAVTGAEEEAGEVVELEPPPSDQATDAYPATDEPGDEEVEPSLEDTVGDESEDDTVVDQPAGAVDVAVADAEPEDEGEAAAGDEGAAEVEESGEAEEPDESAGGGENGDDASEEDSPAEETVTHVVQPGETLQRIAAQYGLTYTELAELNNLANPDHVEVGQVLVISTGATTPPPAETPDASETTYVVKAGDNLYRIGLAHGVSWQAIAEANGLTAPDQIEVGQVLTIPSPS